MVQRPHRPPFRFLRSLCFAFHALNAPTAADDARIVPATLARLTSKPICFARLRPGRRLKRRFDSVQVVEPELAFLAAGGEQVSRQDEGQYYYPLQRENLIGSSMVMGSDQEGRHLIRGDAGPILHVD